MEGKLEIELKQFKIFKINLQNGISTMHTNYLQQTKYNRRHL